MLLREQEFASPQSPLLLRPCKQFVVQLVPSPFPPLEQLLEGAASSEFLGVKISKLYIHCICILQVNPQLPI